MGFRQSLMAALTARPAPGTGRWGVPSPRSASARGGSWTSRSTPRGRRTCTGAGGPTGPPVAGTPRSPPTPA
jgi:hypothetical protein